MPRVVHVPVSNVAIGWGPACGWAEVTDARTGTPVRFPRHLCVLRGSLLCVPARLVEVDGDLSLVRIGRLPPVWVRLHVVEMAEPLAA